jgi:uncharacterized protein (DUF1501 family)
MPANEIGRRDFLQAGAVLIPSGLTGSSPSRNAPATACILLRLVGGPSQLDTWDPKPDAPREIRSSFRPIRTNVPGIEITEIFPRMARLADKFALIRSMHYAGEPLHEVGDHFLRTGRAPVASGQNPHQIGDIIAQATGSRHIVLAAESRSFAENCRQAVALVASGTRFVTVDMFGGVFDETTWDSHGWKPFSSTACYRDHLAPLFDAAYSDLLQTMDRRSLLATTLVVASGEFGRTPRINPTGGRDHWPACWTAILAGGGVHGGQIHGSSDATASEPRDNPVTPAMLAATIYSAIGVPNPDPETHPVSALFA